MTGALGLTKRADSRGWPVWLAAVLLCLATLAARWPGVAMYDTISQYEQALSGDFEDWHPPIMARLWSLLIRVWPGTAPFFLLQSILWWGGFGLLAGALARSGRRGAGWVVLAVGAFPLFVGWETVVLKDAQLACCLLGATGLAAHWRLGGRREPGWARAAMVLLLVYATLVRGNAVFATVPYGLALFGWGGLRGFLARGGLAIGLILIVLAVGPLINHDVLGARSSKVERTLPLYDVVGIAHHAGLATLDGAGPGEWQASERRGCYTPYFWNPYGMPTQCELLGQHVAFDAESGGPVIRLWVRLVLAHPIAWAEHRLRHFNSNARFLVGPGEYDSTPPDHSETNSVNLAVPLNPAGKALTAAARFCTRTPLGWPFLWMGLAGVLLWAAPRTSGPVAALGRALALSALLFGASYAIVSIASDLRYHLWVMVAAALAAVLLAAAGGLDRRRMRVGLVALGLLCVAGIVARAVLPAEPNPYPVNGRLSGAA